MPTHRLAFLSLALAALPTPFAWADDNRLLPFWGQPYPSGYAWTFDEIERSRLDPCPPDRPSGYATRHAAPGARCRVVLHARD